MSKASIRSLIPNLQVHVHEQFDNGLMQSSAMTASFSTWAKTASMQAPNVLHAVPAQCGLPWCWRSSAWTWRKSRVVARTESHGPSFLHQGSNSQTECRSSFWSEVVICNIRSWQTNIQSATCLCSVFGAAVGDCVCTTCVPAFLGTCKRHVGSNAIRIEVKESSSSRSGLRTIHSSSFSSSPEECSGHGPSSVST